MAPPRPHPLAVATAAKLAKRAIEAIWRSGLSPKPPLEPGYLWRIGSRGFDASDERGGRCEQDVADFRERLDRLCQALREEADLNPLGHTLAYGQLTAAIRKRHALGRLWRERPGLAETEIAAPIAVIGQMRSGTTRIHRLFAADPAHAGTRFCDSFDPLPRTPDLRPIQAAFALAVARRINPWLDSLHPFGATRADEEIGWLSAALSPCAYEAQWRIPGYVAWSEARDPLPIYREFSRILRSDAAARGNAASPRILKCPQLAEDLAALVDVLSGIRLVVSHRDFDPVLQSTISMVAGQSAFQSDVRDVEEIEREWRRKLALRLKRMEAGLAGHSGPVAMVEFESLEANWRGAIQAAYHALDLDLTPRALAAMEREQQASVRSPHRRHAESLALFSRQRA